MSCRTFIPLMLVVACRTPEPQHLTLATDIELPAGTWVKMNAPSPMQTPGDNNEICVVPADQFSVDDSSFGIRGPSGQTSSLIGKISRPDGAVDSLENLSITWDSTPRLCLGLRVGDPPSATYSGASLQSSKQVHFREVYWLSTYK